MTDALVLVLVGLCAAVGGGVAGALVAAVSLRGGDARMDKRIEAVTADLEQRVEELDDRMLRFLRKQNKRGRDALEAPQSDDQRPLEGLTLRDRMIAIQRRAFGQRR